jgi:drug/metabolite transporter (DMT)-like permease
MTNRGKLLFLALAFIWGIPYLLIKTAMDGLTPASLVFLRTAIGALILLPVVLLRGDLRALRSRWRPLVLYTVAELAIPWVLLSDAERHISSSLAGLMVATVPLVGALISRLAGARERLGGAGTLGLLAGLAGVAVLLGFDGGARDGWTLVELLLVVLGYAVGPIVIARRLADLPTLDVVAASLALCALAYAPAGILQLPARMPAPAVTGAVLALGVFCTALAFVLFFKLIAEVGSTRATVVAYLNPAVAVLAGVLLLDEPFTAATAAGFLLILGGAWLVTGRPMAGAGREAAGKRLAPLPGSCADET